MLHAEDLWWDMEQQSLGCLGRPGLAVSLCLPVMGLFSGPQVMILITGAHKAFALYKAIEEGVNHMWTVSAFQQHPRTVFVCDEDATLELKVKTVKYFKGEGGVGLGAGGRVQDMPGVGSGSSFHALDILIINSAFNKNQTLSQNTVISLPSTPVRVHFWRPVCSEAEGRK